MTFSKSCIKWIILFLFQFGAALGSKYLAGFGPKVNVKLLPAGNVITEFKSEFRAARD